MSRDGYHPSKEDLIFHALNYFEWPPDFTYDDVRKTSVGRKIISGHLRSFVAVQNFEPPSVPEFTSLYDDLRDPRPPLTVAELIQVLRHLPGDMRVILRIDSLQPDTTVLPFGSAGIAHTAIFDPLSGSLKVST